MMLAVTEPREQPPGSALGFILTARVRVRRRSDGAGAALYVAAPSCTATHGRPLSTQRHCCLTASGRSPSDTVLFLLRRPRHDADMTDENTPLRKIVDRGGYAFGMAVVETIRRSYAAGQQKWECTAIELPWQQRTGDGGGFIDAIIRRDRAVGIIECKKVNNGDKLVFLMRHDQSEHAVECRLEVYLEHQPYDAPSAGHALTRADDRFVTIDCTMATGSPESAFCSAPKDSQLDLDRIASHLLQSCEGSMNNWWIEQEGDVACIPIIVTNAILYTCAFDPAQVDLVDGNLPANAQFTPRPFVRFRKAFKQSAGLDPHPAPVLEAPASDGARTVFVVEARHLVTFLAGLRTLYMPVKTGARLMVTGD